MLLDLPPALLLSRAGVNNTQMVSTNSPTPSTVWLWTWKQPLVLHQSHPPRDPIWATHEQTPTNKSTHHKPNCRHRSSPVTQFQPHLTEIPEVVLSSPAGEGHYLPKSVCKDWKKLMVLQMHSHLQKATRIMKNKTKMKLPKKKNQRGKEKTFGGNG